MELEQNGAIGEWSYRRMELWENGARGDKGEN